MKNRVATIGLVAFLAVDVGLVALALRPGRAPQTTPTATTQTTVAQPGSTGSTGTGTATSTPTGSATAATSAVPVHLLVSGLDAQTAFRAKTGSCTSGGSTLELTTDGGKTWTDKKPPARAIARVQALANSTFVIGASSGCALRQYASTDEGDTWKPPAAVQNGWARSLDKPSQVITPQDPKAEPCDGQVVIDLDRVSLTQAQALCTNGDVRATSDGGTSWSDSGSAPGAVALGNYLDGTALTTYAVRIGSCDGLQLVKVVKGHDPTVVTCVPAAAPKKGQVGMSVASDMGWIVSGSETWVADSGFKTWHRA